MTRVVYIVMFLLIVKNIEAARILAVYPTPCISHHLVYRALTQELIERGHEVVVVTTDPAFPKGQAPPNLTEIDVHEVSYKVWQNNLRGKGNKNIFEQLHQILEMFADIFDEQLKVDDVESMIRNDKFDMLIIESSFRQTLAYSHIFKVPVIQVTSFGPVPGEYETLGTPTQPVLYPLNMQSRVFNLSIWETITGIYSSFRLLKLVQDFKVTGDVKLKQQLGPDIPPLDELGNNVDMFFINVNPIWDGIRPNSQSVIHLGGLNQKARKDLPQDLQTYLDNSKNGVIFVSFGTKINPSLLPVGIQKSLLDVLSQVPYDVLLKWDKDELPVNSKNIKIGKWFPQSDVLRHPKIKLFITQGGLQSTDEAIRAGVPMIGIPTFGDQWSNAEKYLHFNIGLYLEMATLTEYQLRGAIEKILGNERYYRENVARLRAVVHDQPQRPLERAVWWTEHVLRHGGGKHLRAPAANMGWVEYFELELVMFAIFILLTVLFIQAIGIYMVYNHISRLFRYNTVDVKLK